jgi:hypothetical protein
MDLRKSLQRMNLVPEKHRGVDLEDDMDEFNFELPDWNDAMARDVCPRSDLPGKPQTRYVRLIAQAKNICDIASKNQDRSEVVLAQFQLMMHWLDGNNVHGVRGGELMSGTVPSNVADPPVHRKPAGRPGTSGVSKAANLKRRARPPAPRQNCLKCQRAGVAKPNHGNSRSCKCPYRGKKVAPNGTVTTDQEFQEQTEVRQRHNKKRRKGGLITLRAGRHCATW